MKIKTLKLSLYVMAILIAFISCKDDEDSVATFVEANRTEQQAIDKDSILLHLTTHYYNSGFFETGTNHKYTDIIITELPQDEDGNYLAIPDPTLNTLLIDAVETRFATFLDTEYEYYVLNLNQGGGAAPKFTDAVRVRYEGVSIGKDEIFDGVITPIDLLLQGNGVNTFGAIKAWQLIMPSFNSASDFSLDNGIVNYNNYGLGVMFVPSGLAYFSRANTGSSYDNLIFKFELLQFQELDHDNDGVPSYVEDLDGNLEVGDDNTDDDVLPNFIDSDDDGDEVLTIDELIPTVYIVNIDNGEEEPVLADNEYERSRSESAGIITINTVTIIDSNNDGTPDYLDDTVTINYNEDEDN
jgi:FKBP-type peptidyl-prolyl cis-trans isomerase FkpA